MLISIAGYKYSGKSTVKEYLFQKIQSSYCIKFAKPLKEYLSNLLDLDIYYWEFDKETPKPELNNKTKREVLQKVGTELKNIFGKDFFINRIEYIINKTQKKYPATNVFIIDDLRFPNELKYIQNNDGKVIYIERNIDKTDNHESESHYEYIKQNSDYILNNNGTKGDLYFQIDEMIKFFNLN